MVRSEVIGKGDIFRGKYSAEDDNDYIRQDIQLVWVRCRESYDFISKVQIPVHIVNKCENGKEKNLPKTVLSTLTTPNLGDEAVGYLAWIVKNYNVLPEYVVFAHGIHERSFVILPDLLSKCLRPESDLPRNQALYLNLNFFGIKKYVNRKFISLNVNRAVEEHYKSLQTHGIHNFTNLLHSTVQTSWGNTWMVSRNIILRWPKSFYQGSFEAATKKMQQECDNCKMVYNQNNYSSASAQKFGRHTEVGIYYEFAFDFIWNGGAIRSSPPSIRDYGQFFNKRCIPTGDMYEKYLLKHKKFRARAWTETIFKERVF